MLPAVDQLEEGEGGSGGPAAVGGDFEFANVGDERAEAFEGVGVGGEFLGGGEDGGGVEGAEEPGFEFGHAGGQAAGGADEAGDLGGVEGIVVLEAGEDGGQGDVVPEDALAQVPAAETGPVGRGDEGAEAAEFVAEDDGAAAGEGFEGAAGFSEDEVVGREDGGGVVEGAAGLFAPDLEGGAELFAGLTEKRDGAVGAGLVAENGGAKGAGREGEGAGLEVIQVHAVGQPGEGSEGKAEVEVDAFAAEVVHPGVSDEARVEEGGLEGGAAIVLEPEGGDAGEGGEGAEGFEGEGAEDEIGFEREGGGAVAARDAGGFELGGEGAEFAGEDLDAPAATEEAEGVFLDPEFGAGATGEDAVADQEGPGAGGRLRGGRHGLPRCRRAGSCVRGSE